MIVVLVGMQRTMNETTFYSGVEENTSSAVSNLEFATNFTPSDISHGLVSTQCRSNLERSMAMVAVQCKSAELLNKKEGQQEQSHNQEK